MPAGFPYDAEAWQKIDSWGNQTGSLSSDERRLALDVARLLPRCDMGESAWRSVRRIRRLVQEREVALPQAQLGHGVTMLHVALLGDSVFDDGAHQKRGVVLAGPYLASTSLYLPCQGTATVRNARRGL